MVRSLGIALLTLLPAAALAADDPSVKVVDVTPFAKSLGVFHDGKGHYFAVHLPLTDPKVSERLFYGDGKTFYLQPVPSRSRNGADASASIHDPRVPGGAYSSFEQRKGKVSFHCESRTTPLVQLEAKAAAALIKAARFHGVYFQRIPYALARDPTGRYFYVDRAGANNPRGYPLAFRASDFQVYSGMRGKMKPLRMKNVVSDSSGEVFITPDGQLRLILDKEAGRSRHSKAQWLARGKKSELTLVEVVSYHSLMMIHRDLGAYAGKRLERPCDDL